MAQRMSWRAAGAFVPAARVRPLRLSVEEAMKLVLTGGVVKGRVLASPSR